MKIYNKDKNKDIKIRYLLEENKNYKKIVDLQAATIIKQDEAIETLEIYVERLEQDVEKALAQQKEALELVKLASTKFNSSVKEI